jgi:hypothetical protein
LKLAEMTNGARASARFTFRSDATPKMPSPLSFRTSKRRERRAPRQIRAPPGILLSFLEKRGFAVILIPEQRVPPAAQEI